MVYVGCVLIIVLSSVVGRGLVKLFIIRDKFYKELKLFVGYAKTEIEFSQIKLTELFDKFFEEKQVEFLKEFQEIKNYLMQNEKKCLDNKILYFLKREERRNIEVFFRGFGTKGVSEEIGQLEKYQEELKRKINEVESIRKTNEGLIYKLSLAVGVVVCILIA